MSRKFRITIVEGKSYTIPTFNSGETLYNAIGTEDAKVLIGDDKYDPIDAWDKIVNRIFGKECPNTASRCKADTKADREDLVGAHIVTSEPSREIQPGDTYYIIPLCRSCNSGKGKTHIVLDRDVDAVKLVWDGSEKE